MSRTTHPKLKTLVDRVEYDFKTRIGILFMPPMCCTDMGGAIALFTRIDREVLAIRTVSGTTEDTSYVRLWRGAEWEARVPVGRGA